MIQGTLRTVKLEGITALWKGWPATLTGMMMENAAAFGVNEQLQRLFPKTESSQNKVIDTFVRPLLIGACTGAATAVVLCPAENVKVKR